MFNTDVGILNIVMQALSGIDPRLVDHGGRVAYLACEAARECSEYSFDRDKLFELSILHDIGAYKTDEIDNMTRFETADVESHAVYGHLFLKYTSALGDCSEAILYHHTPYNELASIPTEYAHYANLIFLADRADILMLSHGGDAHDCDAHDDDILPRLERLTGTLFDPVLYHALARADEKRRIFSRVRSGEYEKDIEAVINALDISNEAVFEYLKMLVYAIDFRSVHTVTHTANTVSFSMLFAEKLALTEREREELYLGAFLHDVGKIATPIAILEKPGKLTDEEMAVMREHVTLTETYLSSSVPESVTNIACRHHEKLDGSGYPKGLRAEVLTMSERILAIADILSALCTRRSYKDAFDKDKTLSIIRSMAEANKLDGTVCAVLFDNYDEMLASAREQAAAVLDRYHNIKREYHRLTSGAV